MLRDRLRYSIAQWRAMLRSGGSRLFGFGSSVVILAIMSLVTIPAMVAASGVAVWGSIALGQSLGGLGGVMVGYGWGWFGPSKIARNSATGRRAEYIESLATRGALALPIAVIVAVAAYVLAPTAPFFAVAGALQTMSIGLTATWYYVGIARPMPFLLFETLPRAFGAGVGVIFMRSGSSAVMGPICMLFGMIAGLTCSTIWILAETKREGAHPKRLRPMGKVLHANRHGVASTFAMACYVAAPLAIVSIVSPSIQPMFALADKVKLQINVVAAPVVTVLQGWIPRVTNQRRLRRAKVALGVSAGLGALFGIGTMIFGPPLVRVLSNSQVQLPREVIVVIAASISVALFQSVLQSAVLAAFERLRSVSLAIVLGSVIGLPLVFVGSFLAGVRGALGGALLGTVVMVAVELFDFISLTRERRSIDKGPSAD